MQSVSADLPAAPESVPAATLSSLAAQSQRDVELLLNAHPSPLSAPAVTEPDLVRAQRVIVWNDASALRNAGAGGSAAAPPPNAPDASSDAAIPPATQPAADDAATPPGLLQPDRVRSLMVELSRELYAAGAYSDTPLRELLAIAAMSFVDPNRALTPQAIPDLTESERELLGRLQTFFAQLGEDLKTTTDARQTVLDAMAALRSELALEPALSLPTVALCTRVGGFGDYSRFERNAFLANSDQKVILYLEIDGFTSQLNDQQEYTTALSQQLVIYSDRDGIPVWREDWQTAVDRTQNRRQDFFTVQVITLPKALGVGKFTLKVRVRDEKSLAETESSIPFELVADVKLTK